MPLPPPLLLLSLLPSTKKLVVTPNTVEDGEYLALARRLRSPSGASVRFAVSRSAYVCNWRYQVVHVLQSDVMKWKWFSENIASFVANGKVCTTRARAHACSHLQGCFCCSGRSCDEVVESVDRSAYTHLNLQFKSLWPRVGQSRARCISSVRYALSAYVTRCASRLKTETAPQMPSLFTGDKFWLCS